MNLWNLSKTEEPEDRPLFVSSRGRELHRRDIENALKKIGIKDGDVLFVHSDVGAFGKFSKEAIPSREYFFRVIVSSLKNVVGSGGTILMPTFTYSFLKGMEFDTRNSPSETGALTEYFRKLPGVSRTPNPNLSFAIWGKEKKYFFRRLSRDSYGTDSIFGKLRKKNGKILFLGASFQAATFIHYIEAQYGVSYRYPKIIKGCISDGRKSLAAVYEHPVRIPDRYVIFDGKKLKGELERRGLFKRVSFGDGDISVINCSDFFRAGTELLSKNPYFFLHKDFHSRKNDLNALLKAGKNIVKFCKTLTKKKKQKNPQPFFIKGLDAAEVVFLIDPGKAAFGFFLAEQLSRLPVQLKYSYRFLFSARSEEQNSLRKQLRGKKIYRIIRLKYVDRRAVGRLRSLYASIIREINIVEHDGCFIRQKKSFLPGAKNRTLKSWIKYDNFCEETRKIIQSIYGLSDGNRSLSEISQALRQDFSFVRKVVEKMIFAGFLKEIKK